MIENRIGMKLVEVPAGEFLMGSPDSDPDAKDNEKPQHLVRITMPFLMGVHEVTVGQFGQFVKETGYQTDAEEQGGCYGINLATGLVEIKPEYTWQCTGAPPEAFKQLDDYPVACVSWDDTQAFCQWLSGKEGKPYRLPTEAEWEYACRAGTTTRFYSGDDEESLREVANVADASLKEKWPFISWASSWNDDHPFSAPVGKFKPNAFGLHDMHGNAGEWCSDWYDPDYYAQSPQNDPKGPAVGKLTDISDLVPGAPPRVFRVIRGGVWCDPLPGCRSADRSTQLRHPGASAADVGFRVVTSP
jgi:formylglycine-generating enzyme required for sulfatase activity